MPDASPSETNSETKLLSVLTHPAILALGPAVLGCFTLVKPLIAPSHLPLYHFTGSAARLFLAAILSVAIVWAVLTVLLLLARRPGIFQIAVWSGLILMLPWLLITEGHIAGEWALSSWCSAPLFLVPFVAWVAVVCFWHPSFFPVFSRARHIAAVVLGFAALSGLVFMGQLFWCFWQARALNLPRPSRPQQPGAAAAASMAKPRVIWIVLDELSYQQVYERRFPGLDLPAFDSVARQATVFTHVVPAGIYTHVVLPALLTGEAADDIKVSADGSHLSLHLRNTHRWQSFDPHQTIFQDADDQGYRTAVAGWYNPYCRILPGILDRCFWMSGNASFSNLEVKPDAALLSYVVAAWNGLIASELELLHKPPVPQPVDWNHVADYRDLLAAGDRFLDDPSLGFLLIHMPAPHPDGIYDRRTGTFGRAGTSYIDNLALADRYLDHVQRLLEQHGEWDSATIVIMGDHSWRTKLIWDGSPGWTAEDQAASDGGQFDDRPGYIVKLPHQTQPARIDTPFAAVRTRAMLQQIFDGKIRSPAELAAFAELKSSQ
jgi:hypothetical protein